MLYHLIKLQKMDMSGKLNVLSGLPGWQKIFMSLAPMMPKKTMMDFVYSQQIAGSAKK